MTSKGCLLLSPHRLAFGVSQDGAVILRMDYDAKSIPWLAPNVTLALEFTPVEARSIAN